MIRFNGNNIGSVSYGGTPISKIYKGAELVYEKIKQFITGTVVNSSANNAFYINSKWVYLKNAGTVNSDGSFVCFINEPITTLATLINSFKTLDLNNINSESITSTKFGSQQYLTELNIENYKCEGKDVSQFLQGCPNLEIITLPRDLPKARVYANFFLDVRNITKPLTLRCTKEVQDFLITKRESLGIPKFEQLPTTWEILD